MKPDASAAGRGSRLLTEWVLRCFAAFGSEVTPEGEGRWKIRVGPALARAAGRQQLTVVSARPSADADPDGEVLSWDGEVVQRLSGFIRSQGGAAELWLGGADEEEGARLVEARLEIEGATFQVKPLKVVHRPLLAFNFKVRWQGSEGRDEVRSLTFDPATGEARETPPADQETFVDPPARRPAGLAEPPVQAGFEKARATLLTALETKLRQRSQRARSTASDEETRLNAYYSQLLAEERSSGQRRGQKRSLERAEQMKREWRQKLEALGRSGEEARFSLFSAAALWVPWLQAEVIVKGKPKIVRPTEVNLNQRRWDGLACDECGQLHTWLRKSGERLVGRHESGPA